MGKSWEECIILPPANRQFLIDVKLGKLYTKEEAIEAANVTDTYVKAKIKWDPCTSTPIGMKCIHLPPPNTTLPSYIEDIINLILFEYVWNEKEKILEEIDAIRAKDQ